MLLSPIKLMSCTHWIKSPWYDLVCLCIHLPLTLITWKNQRRRREACTRTISLCIFIVGDLSTVISIFGKLALLMLVKNCSSWFDEYNRMDSKVHPKKNEPMWGHGSCRKRFTARELVKLIACFLLWKLVVFPMLILWVPYRLVHAAATKLLWFPVTTAPHPLRVNLWLS